MRTIVCIALAMFATNLLAAPPAPLIGASQFKNLFSWDNDAYGTIVIEPDGYTEITVCDSLSGCEMAYSGAYKSKMHSQVGWGAAVNQDVYFTFKSNLVYLIHANGKVIDWCGDDSKQKCVTPLIND